MNGIQSNLRTDGRQQAIQIVRIAAFCFSIVSWYATAQGLQEYIFSLYWQAALASFGIQAILFVLNLMLPAYLETIQENHLQRIQSHQKSRLSVMKWVVIGFYALIIGASSFFSFVYICDSVIYHHQSGYADDSTMLSSLYGQLLEETREYIHEDTRAMQLMASIQVGNLESMYQDNLGNQGQANLRTQAEVESELRIIKAAWEKKNTDADNAFRAYENAQADVDAIIGEQFYRRDEFAHAQKVRDEKREEYKALDSERTDLNTQQEQLESELKEIKDSFNTRGASFLSLLLDAKPASDALETSANNLTATVMNIESSGKIPNNFGEIVQQTQGLLITIEDYSILKGIADDNSNANSITAITDAYMDNLPVPDPQSENFEHEKEIWKRTWTTRYENLRTLLQRLPRYHEQVSPESLSESGINLEVLSSFDPLRMENEIDNMIRSKLSDINVVERASSLLFSKYRFTAIFSAVLAVFLDIASLLSGLFSYYVRPREKVSRQQIKSLVAAIKSLK